MSTTVIIPIAFFAVAAMVVLIALGWVLINERRRVRHTRADKIRDQTKNEPTASS